MTARKAFPVLFILGSLGMVTAGAEAKVPLSGSEQAEIQLLVKQLGDDDFKTREEAGRKLLALGDIALEAVEAARESKDLEVRRRAERLLPTLRRLREERPMRELRASPPIDQFIDHMATRKECDKPKSWERLLDMADAMTQLGSRGATSPEWKIPKLPYEKFPTAALPLKANHIYKRTIIRVDGIKEGGQSFQDCLLMSGGSLPSLSTIAGSIVFVNGDMAGCKSITDSFVFCNGNIGPIPSIKDSIVLATGNLERLTRTRHVVFQAKKIGGRDSFDSEDCVIIATELKLMDMKKDGLFIRRTGGASISGGSGDFIMEGSFSWNGGIAPLQFVSFFEPAQMGLEFSTAAGHVRIDKIQDGKALAKAGLRAGDVVLAAGTDTIGTLQEFKKFLRRRLPGDEFVLKVRRGENVIECKVKLPD